MQVIPVVGLVAVAAGALYFFVDRRPSDVYAMPVSEAYSRLANVDFGPMGDGEKALNTRKTASGNGTNQVVWQQRGDMAAFSCKLDLAPWEEDANQTRVAVNCAGGGAGEGAAAGMAHNMRRNAFIERVDATLTGRPYDKDLARGATAAGWPGDGVDGSMAKAAGDALKAERDIHNMRADLEDFRKREMAEAAANAADAEEAAVQREERAKASGNY